MSFPEELEKRKDCIFVRSLSDLSSILKTEYGGRGACPSLPLVHYEGGQEDGDRKSRRPEEILCDRHL